MTESEAWETVLQYTPFIIKRIRKMGIPYHVREDAIQATQLRSYDFLLKYGTKGSPFQVIHYASQQAISREIERDLIEPVTIATNLKYKLPEFRKSIDEIGYNLSAVKFKIPADILVLLNTYRSTVDVTPGAFGYEDATPAHNTKMFDGVSKEQQIFLADEDPSPETYLETKNFNEYLYEWIIPRMAPRTAYILTLYYQLDADKVSQVFTQFQKEGTVSLYDDEGLPLNEDELTLHEIGELFCLSRERIRQIIEQGLDRIRALWGDEFQLLAS